MKPLRSKAVEQRDALLAAADGGTAVGVVARQQDWAMQGDISPSSASSRYDAPIAYNRAKVMKELNCAENSFYSC